MNAAAAAIASQIKPGSVLSSLRKYYVGELSTVSHITEKSVYFTDGRYTNKRSLFHYTIVSV
jgi:hypothetical protein